MTRGIGILMLATLVLAGCDEPKTPVDVLILLDGSKSISESERNSTFDTTRHLLRSLPNRSRYAVYILDGELGRMLDSGTRLVDNQYELAGYEAKIKQFRKKLPQQVAQWMREDQTRGNRTCVLKTLLATGRYFQAHGVADRRVVFVLSDMLEDCDYRGKRVEFCSLPGGSFSGRLKSLSPSPTLKTIEVYGILPVRSTANRGCSPDFDTVSATWSTANQILNFRALSIHYFANLPEDFLSRTGTTQ